MMHEFELINHFFAKQFVSRADVVFGIGDDGAIVNIPSNQQLVVTTDTLVNGVHFPVNTSAYDIGYKSLAVNLSDLAAMGATPAWVTLALTLPSASEDWISEFSRGFFELASRYNAQLIGGDLTQGPLSITVQAHGFIPTGQALTRYNAQPGDRIYVTETLGDAGLALLMLNKKNSVIETFHASLLQHLNRPEPRIRVGETLRNIANAAIDISDGLAADLGHILEKSHVGATLYVDQIPLSSALRESVSHEKAIDLALSAGDDYELCFTVPENKQDLLNDALDKCGCSYTCIGMITNSGKLNLAFQNGKTYDGLIQGYQHF